MLMFKWHTLHESALKVESEGLEMKELIKSLMHMEQNKSPQSSFMGISSLKQKVQKVPEISESSA
jgi:hypothetical protein